MPFFKGTSSQRCTFSLLCNSLCFPSIRVKIWEVWISPAVPLGFYVHTDARKFSPVYKFRYIRTRENLHTDINLFSPVYKFCRIRTQVFLQCKIILKIQLIENKEVTLFVQLNW